MFPRRAAPSAARASWILAAALLAPARVLPAPQADQEPAEAPGIENPSGILVGPWRVLGPVDHPAGTDPAPEGRVERWIRDMEPGEPWDGLEETAEGKTGEDRGWELLTLERPANAQPMDTGRVALQQRYSGQGLPTDHAAAFLYCPVRVAAPRALTFYFGSDDGVRFWCNGELVLSRAAGRGVDPYDESVTVNLEEGLNHLLFKVSNGGGAWAFEAVEPRRVDPLAVNAAIGQGVDFLLSRQLLDGSWENFSHNYPNGQTALCTYTLLKCGIGADHPAVLRAFAYMRARPTAKTYSAGCLLMALEAARDPGRYLPWAEEVAGDLLSWQDHLGGWAYPEGAPDLSITQYAVLGLRAAERMGIAIPDEVWEDVMDFTLSLQQRPREVDDVEVAGFRYRGGRPWTGSMTTAGLTNLAIVRNRIGESLRPRERRDLEEAIELGRRWLDVHFGLRNHGKDSWHRYYLYGLERAGALLPADRFGGRDWYAAGAAALLDNQADDGHWTEQHWDGRRWGIPDTDTCFALLFLRRATAPAVTQPRGATKQYLHKSAPEEGPLHAAVVMRNPATFRLDAIEHPRAEDVRSVRWLVRRVDADDAAWTRVVESTDARWAGRYAFPLPGTWQVRAEAVLDDGGTLHSGVVTVEAEVGILPEHLRYATDVERNLLPQQRPDWTVSSNANNQSSGAMLSDNRLFTAWTCARDDEAPRARLELRRSIEVDRILFTHRETRPGDGGYARPARVELVFDDDDDEILVVQVDPDPRAKTVVELGGEPRFRELEIRIVDAMDGTLGAAELGFAEVEFQSDDPRRRRRYR